MRQRCLSTDLTVQAVAKYQADNQPSSENFQNVGRPVALGSLFGALMLLALATGVLAAIGRTPRMLAFVVVLLWLATGIVLVVGAGARCHTWSPCVCRIGPARLEPGQALKALCQGFVL